MSMIEVNNLSFSYPGSYDEVFKNVSFRIDTDWKLGFVGRNGRGKTTFLKLLMGKYEYSGSIKSSVVFDFFPYPVGDPLLFTSDVLKNIAPDAEDWELMRELSLLNVSDDVLWRPFYTLSNGEQTKVLLAALFLNDDHFLLIDEPTNHLDLSAREQVAAYLNRKKGFILVSHDRWFLDSCVDHILSINRQDIEICSGTYSSWYSDFEKRQAAEAELDKRLRSDISKLKKSARQAAEWSDKTEKSKYGKSNVKNSGIKGDKGFIGHKAAKLMKRSKAIEQRKEDAVTEKSRLLKNAETFEELKLSPAVYHSDRLITLSQVSINYGAANVFLPVSFSVFRGDRIALNGGNGSGKSSLLKLIMGEDIPHTGTLTLGSGLLISYVPQDASFLSGGIDAFEDQYSLDAVLFRAVLQKMGFEKQMYDKDLSELSDGQKKKILIAKSLCEKAHLYIWDEPLNFLDIYCRKQIEDLITEYKPAMIFVEHDRAFRDRIATQVIEL